MKISSKRVSLVIALVIIVSLVVVTGVLLLSQESRINELKITNVTDNSFTLVATNGEKRSFIAPVPTVIINNKEVDRCDDGDAGKLCLSNVYNGEYFSHIQVNNTDPSSEYNVKIADTWKTKYYLSKPEKSVFAESEPLDSSIPQLERIYGKIVDPLEVGVAGALVTIENEKSGMTDFSAVTLDNGTYNIAYIPVNSENFFQKINVLTSEGQRTTYATANFYNKPVADIVVGDEGEILSEQDTSSLLVNDAYAANSCFTDTKMGGITAQCDSKTPWGTNLSTSDCKTTPTKFRLGVIKHTTSTLFHKPHTVTLKLYDSVKKEYVKDPATGEELVVKNGGYVDMDKVPLEQGKTYDIEAFDKSLNCVNTDGPNPSVTIGAPAKPGSGTNAKVDKPLTGNPIQLPPMTDNANMCKKIGENFAVPYAVSGEALVDASKMQMRWGEAIVTNTDQMYEYAKTVSDANNLGMNMILRICYSGTCDINDGNAYGNKIVEIYSYLLGEGRLPQSGLFIHAGHNEPNNAEYRDPQEEARFVADVISTVDAAGILSQDAEDIGVKLISPNLDAYVAGNMCWNGSAPTGDFEGCGNSGGAHRIYTAQSYVDAMLENGSFNSNVDKLYAWALNDYLNAAAGASDKVVIDVTNFISSFDSKPGPVKVMITELGNYGAAPDFTPSFPWSDLASTIASLEEKDEVVAILLFNSLGSNKDNNFSYHEQLWNDPSLTQSLFSNCEIGSFSVPQEGSVPVSAERPLGNAKGVPSSGSIGVTGRNGSASSGPYTGGQNGDDPCLGGICVGKAYTDYAVANAGLLSENFEGEFVNDGAAELKVPMYWHAWYQNGCQSGTCGMYSCEKNTTYCKRPEYKQSVGHSNRVVSGKGSAQYFTSYATQHAGLYQHIDIGGGGNTDTKIDFVIRGSSWSDDNRCKKKEGQCVQKDGCHCEIINTFKGRIGIDPTGGIDPTASTIVWTDWQSLPNVQPSDAAAFTEFKLQDVKSRSNRITLFVASNNEYPYRNSDSYWDNAELYLNDSLATGDATGGKGLTYDTAGGGNVCDGTQTPGPGGDACILPADAYLGGEDETTQLVAMDVTKESEGATVLGSSTGSVVLPAKGEYEITSSRFEFGRTTVSNFDNEPLTVPVFQDTNGNGVHDADEYSLPPVGDIKVEKVADVMELELKPGLSIVSMPLYTEDFDTAVKMIEEATGQGGYVTSISTFRNTGSEPGWDVYTQRGNQSYSEDFKIQPGDALYINVSEAVNLRMRGGEYTSPVQQYVRQGWNLISIKGGDSTYTTDKLLQEISGLPGVTAKIVAIWDTSRGRFVTYAVDSDGRVYGEPVVITEEMGILVYVEEGVGYWLPDDPSASI